MRNRLLTPHPYFSQRPRDTKTSFILFQIISTELRNRLLTPLHRSNSFLILSIYMFSKHIHVRNLHVSHRPNNERDHFHPVVSGGGGAPISTSRATPNNPEKWTFYRRHGWRFLRGFVECTTPSRRHLTSHREHPPVCSQNIKPFRRGRAVSERKDKCTTPSRRHLTSHQEHRPVCFQNIKPFRRCRAVSERKDKEKTTSRAIRT